MTVEERFGSVNDQLDESPVAIQRQQRPIPRLLDGRFLIAASAVLAALSLLVTRSPAYDPWTWLLWGREIAHLNLDTSFGPQFKPLPVFVATLSSPFGDAAVPIWMFLAHLGGLLGVGATARLAWRVAGPAAAAVAAGALLSCFQFTFYLLPFGMSEPMLVAFMFWAVDRHCAGRRISAFVLLFGAALLRPEVWPFLFAYAILLYRRREARRAVLVSLLLIVPAAWFLPEWWGSGNPFRTGDGRALPGGPLTQPQPGLTVLSNVFDGMLTWVWAGALGGIAWAIWARHRLMLWLLGLGAVWLCIVAAMTEAHKSSGVTRYLIITQAIVCVACGVGWVKAVRFARDRLGSWRSARRVGVPLLAAGLAVPSLITLYGWVGSGIQDVQYQEGAYLATAKAVELAGGPARLTSCGDFVWSAPYREPEFAYRLGKHLFYARSQVTPDLPESALDGPVVQIGVEGNNSQLVAPPFPLINDQELARATSHGVTAVVLDSC